MALSHKAKRRLSLVLLLVWLPLYAVAALAVVDLFDRPPVLVEALVYAVLGVLWALPFRIVFRGIGREPPPDEGG